MTTYTKQQVMTLLNDNNNNQPKAHYSNDILLQMLDCVKAETFTVESTRGGFALNRGSLCECIVKSALNQMATKTQKNRADINLKGVANKEFDLPTHARKLEVKFATSFAPATTNKTNTKYVLLVTDKGCYIINTANHEGRYTRKSISEGERLEILSEMLGF